ncbi:MULTISPECIES: DUF2860 family protein [Grimontia]|uniref:DUF2860 domain-containing protein n=1 Tax=Grimontia marina TaxID=646534 RepID=A0A128FFI4_9GAMM|nr:MULTISPECIES: DUF2860 family protein [Grimontia]WRV97980.1 DUF2860 domain-containing protein [Grimontia sp. NTOU-MAR1]CZF85255.1 hypothetical protein GMA8713_03449 [Grimontia marina]
MKITKPLIVSISLIPFAAHAGLADKGGLSGEISFIGGMTSTDSNLSTKGHAKKDAPLNSEGSQETDSIFGVLGGLSYTFGQGLDKQIFVGTSRDDIAVGTIAMELGYRQALDSGTRVSVSYLPTVLATDVWKDPFAVGTPRSKTEKSGDAYRLQLDRIGGSMLSLDIAYAQTDIEHEQSGRSLGLSTNDQQSLKRSGDTFYSKLSYRQFLGKGLGITPAFIYMNNESDGDAMSHQSYGGELSYFSFAGRNKIVLTGKYHSRDYDAPHPIFGAVRHDREYSAFLAYEYAHLFEVQPLSFVTLAGYNNTDSNIDFYNASELFGSVGVTYRF